MKQAEHQWVQISEHKTGFTYRFPENLNSTLPQDIFNSPYNWWFTVTPSPNNQTWEVDFGGIGGGRVIYLFTPAANMWQIVYQGFENYHGMWSPDSQREVFQYRSPDMQSGTLFVTEADGSKQWNLGKLPLSWPEQITWDKCGGIEAVLRGE